jgi:hypothetical protein
MLVDGVFVPGSRFFHCDDPRFCIKHGQRSLAFHRNAVQSFHRLSSALDLDLHGLIMKCGPSAVGAILNSQMLNGSFDFG